jgi:hypothetical protein
MQTDVIIFMAGHCETRHVNQAGTTKRDCREHVQEDEHHDLADRSRKWQQILRLQLALAECNCNPCFPSDGRNDRSKMTARCKIEEEDQRKWQLERPKSLTKRGSARRPNLRAFRQGKEDEQHKDRSGRTKGQEEKVSREGKKWQKQEGKLLATTSSQTTLENDMLVQLEKLRGRAEEETSLAKENSNKERRGRQQRAHSGRRCNRTHLHAHKPIHLERNMNV